MRIISGKFKGRRITAPKQLPVRPTTDMAKEALFNILNNTYYFDAISVLDLFSGTGNICYEFASRGTEQLTAVDAHYNCVKFINKTAKVFEMPIHTIKSDVFKFLEKTPNKYDIIFADPPYDLEFDIFAKLPKLIFEHALLKTGGLLIIEHAKHTNLSTLKHYNHTKHYGGNAFSFFEK